MASAVDRPSSEQVRENPAYERIVAAGIQVFGAFGFGKATIQEIAAAAHVSKPLFYRHFRNKQDVFEVVVERVFTDWRNALIDQVEASAAGTAHALRAVFLGALEYGRSRPLLSRLLTRDSQLLLSSQSDVWDRACSAHQELIENILRRGIEAGEVRADLSVEHMADLFTEVCFAYANRQIFTGMAVEAERGETIAACILEGIMRPDAAAKRSAHS